MIKRRRHLQTQPLCPKNIPKKKKSRWILSLSDIYFILGKGRKLILIECVFFNEIAAACSITSGVLVNLANL
jgi:hypothetical protein